MSDGRARTSRIGWAAAGLVAAIVVAPSAHAVGVIETDATTVMTPGAAPRLGFVIIDPCAQSGVAPVLPAVAAPTALGAAPASPAAFSVGSGTAPLALAGTTTYPGGTYDCTTLTVAKTALVTFSGPTTIRATTSVAVQGRIQTTSDDAPLTILCGGDIMVGAVNGVSTGVSTVGLHSDLTFQCVGYFGTYAAPHPPRIGAWQSSLYVRAGSVVLGPNGLGAGLDVDVLATGNILLQGIVDSETGIPMGGIPLSASRDAALRSCFGSVSIKGAQTVVAGRMTIEAAADVLVDNDWGYLAADGGIDVTAFGGRIDVLHGAHVVVGKTGAAGVSTWRARTAVTFGGGTIYGYPPAGMSVAAGSSRFVIESVEGDVEVGAAGATSATGASVSAAGVVEIRAAGAVRLLDSSRVAATDGIAVAVRGAMSAAPGASIESGLGAVVVDGATSIAVAAGARIVGASVAMRTQGPLSFAAGTTAESTFGDLLLAAGSVVFPGAATARGGLRIATLGGLADVRGATLVTGDSTSSAPSGSVDVTAYAGASAAIRAQGATLRSGAAASGAADAMSGDVVLRVVSPTTPSGTPPVVVPPAATPRNDPPFVVPSTVSLKPRRRSTSQDLELRGFVDLGAAGAPSSGAATLSIAAVDFAADLAVSRNGAAVARGADFLVSLGRPRPGSPRRSLLVRARGAFLAADRSGELAIGLAVPGAVAACRVRVENGRFGGGRGRLLAPALYVADVRTLRGGLVRVTLGMPAENVATSEAPDVALDLGVASWHVGRSALVADRGGRFTATSPANGLARLSVAPRARTICADVSLASLGLTTDGGPLEILLRVNSRGVGALRIVLGRPGGRLVY